MMPSQRRSKLLALALVVSGLGFCTTSFAQDLTLADTATVDIRTALIRIGESELNNDDGWALQATKWFLYEAALSKDQSLLVPLRVIAENYRTDDKEDSPVAPFGGEFLTFHAMERLGEPEAFFIDAMNDWQANPHRAAAAMTILGRNPSADLLERMDVVRKDARHAQMSGAYYFARMAYAFTQNFETQASPTENIVAVLGALNNWWVYDDYGLIRYTSYGHLSAMNITALDLLSSLYVNSPGMVNAALDNYQSSAGVANPKFVSYVRRALAEFNR